MMKFKYPLFFVILSIVASASASRLNDAIVQKTLIWNKLNSEQNLKELEKMYPESVVGYGVKSSTSKFMEAKAKFFKWAESFTQTIVSDFTIKKYKSGQIVCEFEKQTTFKGKTKNYPSYLVFEKQGGDYLIIEEGDAITDANIGHKLQLGELKSVDSVALSDIRTTPMTLIVIIGIVVILLLGFLVYFHRKRHHKTKMMFQVHQEQARMNGNQSLGSNQEPAIKTKSEQEIQKEKGDEFEKFVCRSFNTEYFETIHWTSDKGVDGVYARSNQNPDLVMQLNLNEGSYRFAVECKWRAKLTGDNEIEICRSVQLDRYKTYGKKNRMPVFIALGVGGKPEFPEKLYIIPLRNVMHPVVKSYFLEKYYKEPGRPFYYVTDSETLL